MNEGRSDSFGHGPGPLADRVAIVTGGGGGIGAATALALASAGAAVVVADIDGAAAEQIASQLDHAGCAVAAVAVDVTNPDQVDAMIAATQSLGTPEILVNNAGIAGSEMVLEMEIASWRRVVDVNLTGPLVCSKAVLPAMIEKGRGKIINIASIAAKRISFNGSAAYTASKAGLLALTRQLAFEVAHLGINVNAICPGPTDTALLRQAGDGSAARERAKSVPRGRLAAPSDHADAVVFLASDAADMICGVALDIDGGALLGWEDIESYRARRRSDTAVANEH